MRKVSKVTGMSVVVLAIIVTALVEWSALAAHDRLAHPAVTLTTAACTRCHSDPKMLARLQDKAGLENTHPLFLTPGYLRSHGARPLSSLKKPSSGKCPRDLALR